MSATEFREVGRLFTAALALPPDERGAFLDGAAADPELARQVRRLLLADAQYPGFLERPVARLPPAEESAPEICGERRLGPYRLLSRIGSGGMGTVYRADRDDGHFQQTVAIKLLRAGLEDTEALARFRAERQLLARLQHPGIATLHDGGDTAEGRPFLVMELVEGLPLDAWCDGRRVSVDERLDLFLRICDAVQYAHQNLLVHRDLKPANILVTGAGEPKLLDFGIAKELAPGGGDGTGATRTGLRMMTLRYASPEQIRGQAITTATDVYSLGVLLFELLTGASPYRVPAVLPHEIERAICEDEPERASAAALRAADPDGSDGLDPTARAALRRSSPKALAHRLSGDLDNILAMALRKEPERRYASVSAFAADLTAHRRDLPVVARPDTFRYRTQKFVRRHRAAVAAAVVGGLMVLGFLASTLEQSRRLALERDKARAALAFLVGVFKEADPYKSGGVKVSARDILDKGAARVSADLSRQPDVQASLMDAIGQVDLGLGRIVEAAPLLERGLALRQKIDPSSPEVVESLEHVAVLRAEQADFQGAETLLRHAIAVEKRRFGPADPALARTLNQLAQTLNATTPRPEVEALYVKALGIAHEAEGPDGPAVAQSLIGLSAYAQKRGQFARAEGYLRQGLAIEARTLGRSHPAYATHLATLGEILHEQGKDGEAETLLRQALGIQQKTLGPDHPDLGVTLTDLALIRQAHGDYATAEALCRRVVDILRPLLGYAPVRTAEALHNLASTLQVQKKSAEAIALHREVLAMRRRIYGPRSPEVAQSLLLQAEALREIKRNPEALELGQEALAILRQSLGPNHPNTAYALREIGKNLLQQKRQGEAEPYLRQSLELRQRTLPAKSPDVAKARLTLGKCLTELGRFAEAEAELQKGYDSLRGQFGPGDELVKGAQARLDELYRAWGKPAPPAYRSTQ
jgi:serine/threonine protein kinase